MGISVNLRYDVVWEQFHKHSIRYLRHLFLTLVRSDHSSILCNETMVYAVCIAMFFCSFILMYMNIWHVLSILARRQMFLRNQFSVLVDNMYPFGQRLPIAGGYNWKLNSWYLDRTQIAYHKWWGIIIPSEFTLPIKTHVLNRAA